jgi:hypothetical protein
VSSGRKPKSARAKRREEQRRETALVRRLDARARVLTFDPDEFERAVAEQPRLLDVALMNRYAGRSRMFGGCRELLPPEGRVALSLIPAADAVLCKAGTEWSLAPDCWGRPTWPDMLRWGLDKAADACRLLRVGLTYGAVAVARAQLERWTINVAFHHKVPAIGEAERTDNYVRRVWSVYPQIAASVDLGLAWTELSEWLHGRGLITTALREIADAARDTREGRVAGGEPDMVNGMLSVHQQVSTVAEIVLRQVRGGISLIAVEHCGDKFTPALQGALRPETVGDSEQTHVFRCSQLSTSEPSSAVWARKHYCRLRPTGCSSALPPLLTCSPPAYRRPSLPAPCWSGGVGPLTGPGWLLPPSRKGSEMSSPPKAWR